MRLIAKSLRPKGLIIARSSSRLHLRPLPTALIRRRHRPIVHPAITKFFGETWTRTRDSLWSLVRNLNKSKTDASLSRALRRENISWAEYLGWWRAVCSPDGSTVSARSEHSQQSTPETSQPPTWALVHLLSYRTRTPLQAQSTCEAVLSRVSATQSHFVPFLLILCVHTLANHQMLSTVQSIVFRFLQIPQPILYLHYHLLLRAISRFPPSSEISRLVASILEQIVSSGLRIKPSTYLAVLCSPAATATLARRLQKFMILQDVMPKQEALQAFFQIFARRRATMMAFKYFTGNPPGVPNIASSSFRPRMRLEPFAEVSNQSASSITLLNSFKSTPAALKHISLHLKSKDPRLFTSLDIRGWTSILSLTARGNKITSRELLNLFFQMKEKFKPTVVTYTVLIRGLLSRHDYDNARVIWNELLGSGILLDIKSLSAGVELLTLAGTPLQAFRLLEKYAVKPRISSRDGPLKPTHPRVHLSPAFINVFMENLLRINRPDMVFALWDHSEILYRVMPDGSTLNILLSTARLVGKYDDTLSGFLAKVRVQVATTLHSDTPSFNVMPRDEVVQMIESMLVGAGGKKRLTGLWGNKPAWQKAARIFCHAVLGNYPTLLQVSAPAMALRSSADDMGRHPLKELARTILGPPHADAFQDTHADAKAPITLARLGLYPLRAYPKIFPTKITFHNHIFLLGLNDQAAQIPLVMAWMRELGILPMKKTVAMALVFWAEVSLRGPLLERWMGEGEYAKFTRWIENWVGLDRMPGRTRMTKSSQVIARAREGRDYTKK